MIILDKVLAAVTPTENSDNNQQARAMAQAAAGSTGWLATILDHHVQIENAFTAVKIAQSVTARKAALKWLGTLLTGHSIAEEAVICPAMANMDQKSHAAEMYDEQSAAKIQMAALNDFVPMSEDFMDKLEHIEGAIAHHVAKEEGEYFIKLKEAADGPMNGKLTRLYREEFERYMGADKQPSAS